MVAACFGARVSLVIQLSRFVDVVGLALSSSRHVAAVCTFPVYCALLRWLLSLTSLGSILNEWLGLRFPFPRWLWLLARGLAAASGQADPARGLTT